MIARLVLDASVARAVRATEEQARYADTVLRIIERDATVSLTCGILRLRTSCAHSKWPEC